MDLTNGAGTDTPEARWQIAEDVIPGVGIRNMMDPTLGLLTPDPGRMTDPELACSPDDNGGVHTNSGIGNHAYALMVDGGAYNRYTISGIGLTKAGLIAYRTLTVYLTSSSTYLDNYDAMQQSCTDLVGTAGITSADCIEVKKALNSVEMSLPWPCNCGNGVLDPGEGCDDGNNRAGDGCSPFCLVQTMTIPAMSWHGQLILVGLFGLLMVALEHRHAVARRPPRQE